MTKSTLKSVSEEKIQELKDTIAKLGIKMTRQHGRLGVALKDAEAERIRQYKNLSSIIYRARKRMNTKNTVGRQTIVLTDKKDDVLFTAGISEADVRRFKGCFVWESMSPSVAYVKRMTGLNDYQIKLMEQHTGMKVLRKES